MKTRQNIIEEILKDLENWSREDLINFVYDRYYGELEKQPISKLLNILELLQKKGRVKYEHFNRGSKTR